jgi:LiaI-LiaF-like transmembrane region
MNNVRTTFLRAVRGPLLLITLGSLFAIDHFGPYTFTRTWPVLLIVYGILKLLEYVGEPGGNRYGSGSPDGGAI